MLIAWLVACSENNLSELPEAPVDSAAPAEAEAPVADAGPDAEASPLETVGLDGADSSDPAGRKIVAYEWTITSRPDGSTTTLDDPTRSRPAFFADLAGDYVFALTVQNEDGVWDPTPDEVTVNVTPLDGFYVELSWDARTDLDLHLTEGNAALFGPKDCNFCNLNPDFGGSQRSDDPSLDADTIDGFGPETITIDEPSPGEYTVQVHFYGKDGDPTCPGGCPDSIATVRIFLGGIEAASFRQKMAGQGSLWEVATLSWPSGDIEELQGLGRTDELLCR